MGADVTAFGDDLRASHDRSIIVAGVLGALVAYAGLTAVALSRNGWGFEYPLDDVYIHLAMAEQIANGGYGVNPGEYASAASSPLYPLLLTPFAGTSWQGWLPLVWNITALCLAAALFARSLSIAGLARPGIVLAALAPLCLAAYVTAFTGMENMAHAAASLAIVLGLWKFVETDRIGWTLYAAVILASALRLEGIAMGLAAGVLIAVLGRVRPGIALMASAVAPLAVFALFLMSLGLGPLPNSVVAKLGDVDASGPLGKLSFNAASYGGRYLLALSSVLIVVGIAVIRDNRRRAYFALAVGASGLAHLAFGSVGWMDRYETYAVMSCVAALALVLKGRSIAIRASAVTIALVAGALTYAPYSLSVYAWNPAAIAQQHGQMARLAKDFVKQPVAVNDLGYVAWRNPNYVLDLWGLASSEALQARRADNAAGWAGPLAAAKGVTLAMVYDDWVGDAVPAQWVRLGVLRLDIPTAFLGGRDVAFYASASQHVEQLSRHIAEWKTQLPQRASFIDAEARP